MTRINTNVASLRGLRNLQRATDLQNQSLTRLSTGLKINSGKDNPSGLIASENLRLQTTSIEQSIQNSNRANNVIGTADAALGEISGLLNEVRGLVQEGVNEGALSDEEIDANQLEIDSALQAINRIAANTKFGGDKLIDGSKAFTTQLTSADSAKLSDFQVNEALFGSSSTVEIDATVTSAAEQGTLTNQGGDLLEDTTLEVSGAKGSQVLFFDSSSDVDNIRDAINSVSDVTGVDAEITTAESAGSVSVSSSNGNEDITFTEDRVADRDITINFVNNTNNSNTLVTDVSTDSNNDVTIEVDLGDDNNGNITAVATDIANAVNNDANASAIVTADANGNSGEAFAAASPAATINSNDRTLAELTLTSSEYGSDQFVDVNVLEGTFDTNDASGSAATRDAGADIGVQIDGQSAQTSGLEASVKTSTLDASVTFAEGSNTVNTTATVSVTGGGSLFQIGQDVSTAGQIGLGIEAVNTARLGGVSGKLFELGSGGGKSLKDVGPNVQGSELVDIIEESLDRVSSLRGRLGSIQKNVIETNISTLEVARENISQARSQIVDTDFARETANLTRAQILSQAGISVLSTANNSPQQVLSLLGG